VDLTVPPDPVDPLDADESLGSTETCDWRTSGLTLGCVYSERLALSEGGVTFRFHFVFPSRRQVNSQLLDCVNTQHTTPTFSHPLSLSLYQVTHSTHTSISRPMFTHLQVTLPHDLNRHHCTTSHPAFALWLLCTRQLPSRQSPRAGSFALQAIATNVMLCVVAVQPSSPVRVPHDNVHRVTTMCTE
jgi:hypothetical protein